MADRLSWTMLTKVAGMDGTASDTLMQPDKSGRLIARALHGLDPFDVIGMAVPSRGYVKHSAPPTRYGAVGAGTWVSDTTAIPVVAWKQADGSVGIYIYSGGWQRIDTADMPFSGDSVAFASGYNALFIADGVHRVRVYGWNYSPEDPTLHWNQDTTMAEILYTNGQKSTPPSSDDDFIATGMCFHATRLVLYRGNTVRMSAPFMPTVFYDDENPLVARSWMRVEDGSGGHITWAGTIENQILVVSLAHSLHGYVAGDDGISFSHMVLDGSRGVFAPRSAVLGGQRLYYCSEEGPCWFDMKDGSSFIGGPVQSVWNRLTMEQKRDVVGVWFRNRYGVLLPASAVPGDEVKTLPSL